MSAPTPPPAPSDHRRSDVTGARSTLHAALDVVARVGTAVTLAALLVLIGMVLTLANDEPTPAGVGTPGR